MEDLIKISVEELESKLLIEELARNLLREVMEQQEKEENPLTINIRLHCHNSLLGKD